METKQFRSTSIQKCIEQAVTDGRGYKKPISGGDEITDKQLSMYLMAMELARPSEVFQGLENGIFEQYVDRRSEYNLSNDFILTDEFGSSETTALRKDFAAGRYTDRLKEICESRPYRDDDIKLIKYKPKIIRLEPFENGYDNMRLTDIPKLDLGPNKENT